MYHSGQISLGFNPSRSAISRLPVGDEVTPSQQPADDVPEAITNIPLYDASLAAGAGSFNENATIIHQIPFRKEFLRQITNRSSTKNLAILTANGDSMEPTISNDDIVLIDERSKDITDGIFCFLQDGLARVKRLRKLAAGAIEIISDNRALYSSETITPSEAEPFHIIGRVCWVGTGVLKTPTLKQLSD